MVKIHQTAIVSDRAVLGDNVTVGPYCIVGDGVELDDGVSLHAHVVVEGSTRVGANTRVFPFACVGMPPQDMKYRGEPSRLEIGCNNIIREHVTVNPGTKGGGMLTRIGNNCLFMVGSHVAHDCHVGDHVILVNNATLAGHVDVGEWVIVGGLSAVHQYVRVGRHAMIGGMSGVENDVIPYGSVVGNRARLSGLNIVGLKRRGFSRDIIHSLRNAYRLMFAPEGTMAERLGRRGGAVQRRRACDGDRRLHQADASRAICQPLLDDAA